jgi:hypothetical protein
MAADLRPDRLEYVRSQYPSVAVSRDIDAVLNNPSIDGVIVATPVETHFDGAGGTPGRKARARREAVGHDERAMPRVERDRRRACMVSHSREQWSAPGKRSPFPEATSSKRR